MYSATMGSSLYGSYRSYRIAYTPGTDGSYYYHSGYGSLLFDVAFGGMAATIIFGLTFATLLTLFVTPALYSMFYKVKRIVIMLKKYILVLFSLCFLRSCIPAESSTGKIQVNGC